MNNITWWVITGSLFIVMTSFGVAHFQQKGRGRLAYYIIIYGVGTLIFWGGLFYWWFA